MNNEPKIIGITGQIGSGATWLIDIANHYLKKKYKKLSLKLSIKEIAEKDTDFIKESDLYEDIYDFINIKRKNCRYYWAEKTVEKIKGDTKSQKQDYIFIHNIRSVDEVKFLQEKYDYNFILLSCEARRDIREKLFTDNNNIFLKINNDKEYIKDTQKCVEISDYHIISDKFVESLIENDFKIDEDKFLKTKKYQDQIKHILRFCDILEDPRFVYPKKAELAMVQAYNASLSSKCLSRQVGAVITDKNDYIIAEGWNDVPKTDIETTKDHLNILCCNERFHDKNTEKFLEFLPKEFKNNKDSMNLISFKGCYSTAKINQLNKKIKAKIIDIIETNIAKIIKNESKEIVRTIAQEILTGLNDFDEIKGLTEFSRAVHAEQNALIQLARTNSPSSSGCKIYVTTFPCHHCLKLIIAAGIREIIFVEPYPKSLWMEMYPETIVLEREMEKNIYEDKKLKNKVVIKPFQGVKAQSFFRLFKTNQPRKNKETGKIES